MALQRPLDLKAKYNRDLYPTHKVNYLNTQIYTESFEDENGEKISFLESALQNKNTNNYNRKSETKRAGL